MRSSHPTTKAALQMARDVLAELDVEEVLTRALRAAQELTGARYAALGVLDPEGRRLERFLTLGVDEETRESIGAHPTGRGVLGELIAEPVPLRLADVGSHPHSYGFPLGHPTMHTFLGVPIFVGRRAFGNLYLTEKETPGGFTDGDEEATVLLAEFAGLAIDHARRYTRSERSRMELERTVEALDATVAIARTLAAQTELATILDLVAKRGRALVDAKSLTIELVVGDELEVAGSAGEAPEELVGSRLALAGTVAERAISTQRSERIEEVGNRSRFRSAGLGRLGLDAEAGLVVPLILRGRAYGALIVVDRLERGPRFTDRDEELLTAFATSAATALATARSVDVERRRERLAASEAERIRWARELDEGTLGGLARLRVRLGAIETATDLTEACALAREAREEAEREIETLRSLVADLRPPALGGGLAAPLAALVGDAERRGATIDATIRLERGEGGGEVRLDPEIGTAAYRLVQEALANALRHSGAERIALAVALEDDDTAAHISITVRDDGRGFDPSHPSGSGLTAIREQVTLLGGELQIHSEPGAGTEIRATLPVRVGRHATEWADLPSQAGPNRSASRKFGD